MSFVGFFGGICDVLESTLKKIFVANRKVIKLGNNDAKIDKDITIDFNRLAFISRIIDGVIKLDRWPRQ